MVYGLVERAEAAVVLVMEKGGLTTDKESGEHFVCTPPGGKMIN